MTPLDAVLLARGADPNRVTAGSVWRVKGPTAVHMAAIWNLPEALTLTLDAGGDPNVAAGDGSRPLACAKSKTTEILLARGATSCNGLKGSAASSDSARKTVRQATQFNAMRGRL